MVGRGKKDLQTFINNQGDLSVRESFLKDIGIVIVSVETRKALWGIIDWRQNKIWKDGVIKERYERIYKTCFIGNKIRNHVKE